MCDEPGDPRVERHGIGERDVAAGEEEGIEIELIVRIEHERGDGARDGAGELLRLGLDRVDEREGSLDIHGAGAGTRASVS